MLSSNEIGRYCGISLPNEICTLEYFDFNTLNEYDTFSITCRYCHQNTVVTNWMGGSR